MVRRGRFERASLVCSVSIIPWKYSPPKTFPSPVLSNQMTLRMVKRRFDFLFHTPASLGDQIKYLGVKNVELNSSR